MSRSATQGGKGRWSWNDGKGGSDKGGNGKVGGGKWGLLYQAVLLLLVTCIGQNKLQLLQFTTCTLGSYI